MKKNSHAFTSTEVAQDWGRQKSGAGESIRVGRGLHSSVYKTTLLRNLIPQFLMQGNGDLARGTSRSHPAIGRSHIANFIMGRDVFRIIARPKKGENVDLVREKITLADSNWHPVHIVRKGETISVEFKGRTWTTKHPVAAEPNIGFGGDCGGPEGEKAGALEFRQLIITTTMWE